MGLVLFSLAVAGGLGLLAGCALYRTVRLFGRPRWGITLAMFAGAAICCMSIVPVFTWMRSATTTIVIGASPDAADGVMSFLGLPTGTASDFSYRRSVQGTCFVADFLMKEEHYLDWMRSKGWNAVQVGKEGAEVYPVRDFESGQVHHVARGWRYYRQKPDNPDCTETFTFDAEAGRAYVLLTLW